KAEKDGKDFLVSTELRSQRGELGTLHARADIRLSGSLPKYDASRELTVSGQPYALSKTEIYENVLFHGHDFQSIESVSATAREGMIAQVRTAPAPGKWLDKPLRGTWISDPLALDSAFQLMILWSVEYHEAPSLPCAIGSYRQFKRSFPKSGVELRIAITRESSHQAKADIEFVDNKGQVVARIDNFECVMDASLKKAFRLKQLVSEQQSGEQLS
ncbi:MAG: polyketide synthase dehydratase domain-containing protein, partial [Planctomycetota bacterium]|nr:polyketide synthase dehydratase domain-containing protein [Planctomycetota bacterium]